MSTIYSRTSMARTHLGPWKIVRDMGSSIQKELSMVPVRKHMAIFRKVFSIFYTDNGILSALIRIASTKRF